MFKSNKSMAAMALFTSSACAIRFRPIPGTVPWHDSATYPEWTHPTEHDIDYFVPHFGADSDINASLKNLKDTEEKLGHELQASFDPPKAPPRDYFVPNFGEDDDIKATKKNTKYAEAYHQHEMDTSPAPGPPPRDYFVPHFGEDEDIKGTKVNIALVESKLNHTLDTSPPPADPPRNYFVPHFGEDEDIEFSKRNIASAEKKYGEWNVKRDGNGAWILPSVPENLFDNYKAEGWPHEKLPVLVQTDAEVNTESDPICSSAGCTQYKHKKKGLGYDIDYFVPNFGADHDINENFESIKLAESMVGHEFQIGSAASKKKWANKAKDADYNFRPALDGDVIATQKNLADAEDKLGHKWVIDVQLDSDIKVDADEKSDPICSSAGCTQYKHKSKGLGYDIDYFVPNFGRDHLITQNFDSLDLAEKQLGHKWNWTEDKPDKVTEYNVHKPMDPDIVDSMKNLKDQEGIHGKWNLHPDDYFQVQLAGKANTDNSAESDPICSSAGCTQYKHKKKDRGYDINYPVPNFGVDHDIIDNHHSLEIAEGALSHKLEMATEKSKAKWHNPAKDTDYNFAPKLDGDMIATAKHLADSETNLGHKWVIDDLQIGADVNSDPICSSAGCTQYKHKKKDRGYDINYPVPNFGVDHDILDNHHSLEIAEGALSHKLEMATEKSKAKWHNPAKDTDYNFAPKLDGDMISTAKHLADSENNLGHKWVIDDIQLDSQVKTNSDPICASSGCPKSKWTEEEEKKIVQYPDPEAQGLDSDIRHTIQHEGDASDRLGHIWKPYGYN